MSFLSIMAQAGKVASTPAKPVSTGGHLSVEDKMKLEKYKYDIGLLGKKDTAIIQSRLEFDKHKYTDAKNRREALIKDNNETAKYYLDSYVKAAKQYKIHTGSNKAPVTVDYIMAAHMSPRWGKIMRQKVGGVTRVKDDDPASKFGFKLMNTDFKWASSEDTLHQSAIATMAKDKQLYKTFEASAKTGHTVPLPGIHIDPISKKVTLDDYMLKALERYRQTAGLTLPETYNMYKLYSQKRIDKNVQGDPKPVDMREARKELYPGMYFVDLEGKSDTDKKGKLYDTFTPLDKIGKKEYGTAAKGMQSKIVDISRQVAKDKGLELGYVQMSVILANAAAESDFVEGAIGDNGNSIGLFQINMKAHWKALGISQSPYLHPVQQSMTNPQEIKAVMDKLKDPGFNIEYMLTKVNGGALNNKEFMAAKTFKEANRIFVEEIMIPKDQDKAKKLRLAYANEFKDSLKKPVELVSKKRTKGFASRDGETEVKVAGTGSIVDNFNDLQTVGRSAENIKELVEKQKPLPPSLDPVTVAKTFEGTTQFSEEFKTHKGDKAAIGKAIIHSHNKFIYELSNKTNAASTRITRLKELEGLAKTDAFSKIAKKNTFTHAGLTKDIPTQTDINHESVTKALDNEIKGQGSTREGDVGREGAFPSDLHFTQLAIFEKWLQNEMPNVRWDRSRRTYVANSGADSEKAADVNWAVAFRRAWLAQYRGTIIDLIQKTSQVRPKKGRAQILLSEKLFPALTDDSVIEKVMQDTYATRKLFFEKSKKKAFRAEKRYIDGVEVYAYTPVSKKKPEDREWDLKTVEMPNTRGDYEKIATSFMGPEYSIAARVLGEGNTVIDPTGQTSPDRLTKVNAALVKTRNLAKEYLENPHISSSAIALIRNIENTPEYKRFKGLDSQIVKGIGYISLIRYLKNQAKDYTENYQGLDVPGQVLPASARKLSESQWRKTGFFKEYEQIRAYAPTLLELIDSSFSTINEAGILNLQKNIDNLSQGQRKIYDMALENAQKEIGTKGTTGHDLHLALKDLEDHEDPEISEAAKGLNAVILGTGGQRLSDIPGWFDRVVTKISTLAPIAVDLLGEAFTRRFKGLKADQWAKGNYIDDQGEAKIGHHSNWRKDLHTIRNKSKRSAELLGFEKQARKDLEADLKAADREPTDELKSLARTNALLNARRTFNAITLTYMFAGMVQGGSGGRAISNEDFEHLYDALWSSGGRIQAVNLLAARRLVLNSYNRARMGHDAARYGEGAGDAVFDAILPIQRLLTARFNQKDTRLIALSLTGHNPVSNNAKNEEATTAFIQGYLPKDNFRETNKIGGFENGGSINRVQQAFDNMLGKPRDIQGTSTAQSASESLNNPKLINKYDGYRRNRSVLSYIEDRLKARPNMEGIEVLDLLVKQDKSLAYELVNAITDQTMALGNSVKYHGERIPGLAERHSRDAQGMSMANIMTRMKELDSKLNARGGKRHNWDNPWEIIVKQYRNDVIPLLVARYLGRSLVPEIEWEQ